MVGLELSPADSAERNSFAARLVTSIEDYIEFCYLYGGDVLGLLAEELSGTLRHLAQYLCDPSATHGPGPHEAKSDKLICLLKNHADFFPGPPAEGSGVFASSGAGLAPCKWNGLLLDGNLMERFVDDEDTDEETLQPYDEYGHSDMSDFGCSDTEESEGGKFYGL